MKPDTDNYIKSTLDGLNGLLWDDDNQIVDLVASKFYSDNPRVEIEVEEVG
nr:RusA family crossover junction endodeoxyribonuclease [Limosilactobacillus oris]